MDRVIFFCVLGMILLGIIFVMSASFYAAKTYEVSPYYFFIRQAVWALPTMGALIFFMMFDYTRLKDFVKPIVIITILLLAAVFIPGIGKYSGGARRWIDFRLFLFNPSELAKISVIIYLSYILAKKQSKLEDFTFGILPPLLLVAVIFFIILMQSGFSTAVLLLLVAMIMFFIGGASVKHLLSILLLSVPVMVMFIVRVAYRLDRIFAYLNPWDDPSGKGYHIIQSQQAFVNGGLLGLGLGNSVQKIKKLPTPHTDFIFSIIAEETGILGAVILMSAFFLFFIRGMMIAVNCKDKFGQLLAFGIVSLITLHAILNMAIATGIIPTTGVSLPFISYGGSSMLMMAVGVGILLNISAQNEIRPKMQVRELENIIQEGFSSE
jgi:cell division protein FtsW